MKSRALSDIRIARLEARARSFASTRLKHAIRHELPALNRAAISACVLIVTERERFPELGNGKGQARFLFTSKDRERHLLRLEAMALVLMCLLSHMDLVTRRAGRRRRDGSCDAIRACKPYGKRAQGLRRRDAQTTIESETGLGRSAVERALSDLRAGEYVESFKRSKKYWHEPSGTWKHRGFPAIHIITKRCLERLGITLEWLEEQAAAASKRQQEGPDPVVDVRAVRAQQRIVRQQALAAKRARLETAELAKAAEDRLERLFGKKLE
jgi:hypothetical protein